MSESSSYSSLLALVDSHLSKVNIQSSHLENGHTAEDKTIQINTQSDVGTYLGPGKRLAIPSFNPGGDRINNVLAKQVSNMLKAKQAQEKLSVVQREPQNKDPHLNDDLETDYEVINLVDALRTPFKPAEKSDSNHSSTESLFEPEFIEFDDESSWENHELQPESLTCQTDLSYILDFKIPQARCSSFGKILVSRIRPFSLLYIKNILQSSVQKFDFKSKSPCDLLKEKTVHKKL